MISEDKDILRGIFKGHNPVANLQKMTLYDPNVDLVNDNMYTNLVKFCPTENEQ